MSTQDVAPPGWFAMPDGTTMYWSGAEWQSADPQGNTSPPQPKVWRPPTRREMVRAIVIGVVLGTLLGLVFSFGSRLGVPPLWAFALTALVGALLGAGAEYFRYGRRHALSIAMWLAWAGLMFAVAIYMWRLGDTTIDAAAERYRWEDLTSALVLAYVAATIAAGWHNINAMRPSKAERRAGATPGGTTSREASGGAA